MKFALFTTSMVSIFLCTTMQPMFRGVKPMQTPASQHVAPNISRSMSSDSPIKGIYQHSRSGNRYEVLGSARFSEDPNKEFVVYKQLYESQIRGSDTKLPVGSLWVRPKEMFFEVINGQPRFKKVQ